MLETNQPSLVVRACVFATFTVFYKKLLFRARRRLQLPPDLVLWDCECCDVDLADLRGRSVVTEIARCAHFGATEHHSQEAVHRVGEV